MFNQAIITTGQLSSFYDIYSEEGEAERVKFGFYFKGIGRKAQEKGIILKLRSNSKCLFYLPAILGISIFCY